jgi:hypothetical protein
MADAKAILTLKNVLLSTQGATGQMLSEGLVHALRDGQQDRHELQVALLKMVEQVLTSSKVASKLSAEGVCQQKFDAASAELEQHKAATASATADLAAAKSSSQAHKERLDAAISQQSLEEQEHTRVEALDSEKAKEVTVLEEGKAEVVALLGAMAEKGNGEAILGYLRNANAETPLVAALRSVLQKEPTDRIDFDAIAMEHLRAFLEHKVAEWEAQIQVHTAAKANIHAEMLGAWAIKQVAADRVREATAELETAEAAAQAAQQTLKQARLAEQQKERILSDFMAELTLAGEKANQCEAALCALERLVSGRDESLEAAAVAEPVVTMDVDADVLGAKMDARADVEMGTPIAA